MISTFDGFLAAGLCRDRRHRADRGGRRAVATTNVSSAAITALMPVRTTTHPAAVFVSMDFELISNSSTW